VAVYGDLSVIPGGNVDLSGRKEDLSGVKWDREEFLDLDRVDQLPPSDM